MPSCHWLMRSSVGTTMSALRFFKASARVAGKTFVATLALALKKRSALIVVPTLDLMSQWHDGMRATFDVPIGLVGGGYHEVTDLTITTYDSAYLHMDRLGNRFGLVVFDECHHLPSDAYATAARMCIAP